LGNCFRVDRHDGIWVLKESAVVLVCEGRKDRDLRCEILVGSLNVLNFLYSYHVGGFWGWLNLSVFLFYVRVVIFQLLRPSQQDELRSKSCALARYLRTRSK
jgi:hypothetical protein